MIKIPFSCNFNFQIEFYVLKCFFLLKVEILLTLFVIMNLAIKSFEH